MKKSTLLVAVGALALSACDFAGSTDSATVPVASIEVSSRLQWRDRLGG